VSRFGIKPMHWKVGRDSTATLPEAPRSAPLLDIVIADTLARYWLVTPPAGLASGSELDLYLADQLATIFGDDPSRWSLRVDPVPGGSAMLACALPLEITTRLTEQATRQGWTTRHLQPRFIYEYNRHCHRLPSCAAFCVASRDSTALALIANGQWRSIRVHPPLNRTGVNFTTLLRRDCHQAGLAADELARHVVGSQAKALQ
jgi:hypothetical protein